MLEELKQMYGEHIYFNQQLESPEKYIWFEASNGEIFAIRKNVITDNEKKLLALSFKPVSQVEENLTDVEMYWKQLLFMVAPPVKVPASEKNQPFQFIHVHCKKPVYEQEDVNEALRSFFPNIAGILWSTDRKAVVILHEQLEESMAFDEIIDTMASDLFIDLSLFIGYKSDQHYKAKAIYDIQEKMFELSQHVFPKRRCHFYRHGLPLLFSNMKIQNHEPSFSSLFDDLLDEDDDELLSSIEVFLESNMNLSIAAKKLYVHRNSLQYRVDKFFEKTGLNPKEFPDAVTIYLLLIGHRMKTF